MLENKVNRTTEEQQKKNSIQKWTPYQILGGKNRKERLNQSTKKNTDMADKAIRYVVREYVREKLIF